MGSFFSSSVNVTHHAYSADVKASKDWFLKLWVITGLRTVSESH